MIMIPYQGITIKEKNLNKKKNQFSNIFNVDYLIVAKCSEIIRMVMFIVPTKNSRYLSIHGGVTKF